MGKNYGRSLLLTSSVLVGAISLPLLISCGAGETNPQATDRVAANESANKGNSIGTILSNQAGEGSSQTTMQQSQGEGEGGLDALISLYANLGKALVEREESNRKIEALSAVVDAANSLKDSYGRLLKQEIKVRNLRSQIRIAKSEVDLAYENNYRAGKEIVLYLLGLKILWGAFTGYAPTTSTYEQEQKLSDTIALVQPKLDDAEAKLKDMRVEVKDELDKVVKKLDSAITTIGDLNPTLQKRLTSSKYSFVEVVTSLLETEQQYSQRYDILLRRYMMQSKGVPTLVTDRNSGFSYREGEPDLEEGSEIKLPRTISTSFGLTPIGDFEKSNFNNAGAKLTYLRRKLEALTQVLPGDKINSYTLLSPAIILSEELNNYADSTPRIEELKKRVKDQESTITEEEKASVDDRITAVASEISELQKERELANSKLADSYSTLKTLNSLSSKAYEIFEDVSKITALKSSLAISVDRLLQAENTLNNAKRDGVSFFRELALYVIGFKWL